MKAESVMQKLSWIFQIGPTSSHEFIEKMTTIPVKFREIQCSCFEDEGKMTLAKECEQPTEFGKGNGISSLLDPLKRNAISSHLGLKSVDLC
jgi:hypothetical protein